jgi:hypothetical protein
VDHELTLHPATFPEATELNAYAVSDIPYAQRRSHAEPTATPVDTQTVTSGEVTFTGLDYSTQYVAGAEVDDEWRQISFTTPVDPATDEATQGDIDAHTGDTTDSHDASAVSFNPAAGIAATNVQAALEELVGDIPEGAPDLSDTLRLITRGGFSVSTGASGGVDYVPTTLGGQNALWSAFAVGASQIAGFAPAVLSLLAADYDVAGYTTKLLMRSIVVGNGSNAGITFTVALRPLTVPGGILTPGSAVAGSDAVVTAPASQTFVTDDSTEFAFPTDGIYAPTLRVSGAPGANTSVFFSLFAKHVPS